MQLAYIDGKVHPMVLSVVVVSIAQAKDVLFKCGFILKVRKVVELFWLFNVRLESCRFVKNTTSIGRMCPLQYRSHVSMEQYVAADFDMIRFNVAIVLSKNLFEADV